MITPYKKGDYLAVCDRCAEKMYGSMLQADGMHPAMRVCNRCYWRKHPNETPTYIPDDSQPIPNARPEPELVTTSVVLTEADLRGS